MLPIIFRFGPLLFVPAFAIIGAASNQREWLGAMVGGGIGLFFALAAMGWLPLKLVNWMYPRETPTPR